jgi:ABC-2 type transport system ATP-binding protein
MIDSLEQDTAASKDVVIKCVKLTKVFRDFWMRNRVRAVDEIDLEVYRGEVFGLLGPNGSGKSTTIKMILGLLHSTSGRIAVLGKRPENVANKNLIGYLPEETYLYRFLNARETLDYYARLFHLNRQARARRIDMLLEMVGLEHAAHRPVGEYSKGMQRKVGMAQALINDPDLLILDEPTSGMDPVATNDVKRLIKMLGDRGKTVLLCSHLLSDVEDVCDRAAIMFGGKVREQGTIDELLTEQQSTTIRAQSLDDETIEEIESVLASRGKHIEKVEQPRQTLESKFLDIVYKAQSEGQSTSGARSGGRIAEFLATNEDEGSSVINSLIAGEGEPEMKEEVVPEQSEAELEAEAAIKADADAQAAVISGLIETEAPPEEEAVAVEPVAEVPAVPSPALSVAEPGDVDLSVIDGLVGAEEPVATENEPPRQTLVAGPSLNVDDVVNDLAGQAEAETPQASEPEPDVSGNAVEPRSLDASEEVEAAETKSESTEVEDDEKPDQGFIDALLDVPPHDGAPPADGDQ